MPGSPPRRSRREIVEENRRRLLVAAEELVAQRGLGVTLNDIAHHAGVGVGTAYRRFANKAEVMDALFTQRLDEAVALANDCLADADAWHGLTEFLTRSLQLEVENRGGLAQLIKVLGVAPQPERVKAWRDQLGSLVDRLVERARDQGTLRPEIVTADIVLIRSAIATVIDETREVGPDVYRRYLTIVMDGLRASAGSPTPLPVAALSLDDSHAGMSSVRWQPDTSEQRPAGSKGRRKRTSG